MAPNRKSLNVLVQSLSNNDLADLQNTVQPKYLPLTQDTSSDESTHVTPAATQPQESASYWDWSSPAEEDVVCVLSTDNIVSNLIQASATLEQSATIQQNDDYWGEECTNCTQEDEPKESLNTIESSYWEWPADQDATQAELNRILTEERAYQIVSGAQSEANEQKQVTKSSTEDYWAWKAQPEEQDAADYWAWETETKSPETRAVEEKQAMITGLIEYEAARQLLMASTIVSQLEQAAKNAAAEDHQNMSNDDYWSWQEDLDNYWDMPAFTAKAATPVTTGYWDM